MLQIEHAVQGPPTGSSGHKVPYLDVANTWSAAQTITIPGSGVPTAGTALALTSTAADAASGPNISLLRDSASPAASDLLGCLVFQGRNDANALITYNQLVNQITSAAAGAEASVYSFWTEQAGAQGVRLLIGAGIYTGGAAGGDKGVNTINATALYEAGVALTAKYGQLATANAWLAAQAISGAAGGSRTLFYQTSGSTRWSVAAGPTAESGSNAGSDYTIQRYDDTGALIEAALVITRSNGAITVIGDYTQNARAGVGTSFTMNKAVSGTANNFWAKQAGVSRWTMVIGDSAAESTGNVGSNFKLYRYTDAGTIIDAPISIDRSTGILVLAQGLSSTAVATFNAGITLNGAAGTNRVLQYNTAGSPRWIAFVSATAESGSNAGSDFIIQRYTDAGAFIDQPLTIARSSGFVSLSGGLNVAGGASMQGDLNISKSTPTITLTKAASGQSSVIFGANTANKARWAILPGDAVAESGSNAGSNFALYRYDDAGNFIDSPFNVNRSSGSTGVVALGVTPATGASQITMSPVAAAQQATIGFFQSGTAKWQVGKQTDDSFFIYDSAAATYLFSAPSNGTTVTFGKVANLKGVTDGSNAAAGFVGEFVTASVGTSFNIATATPTTLLTLTLTAGDWDVDALCWFNAGGGGFGALFAACINTVTNNLSADWSGISLSSNAATGMGVNVKSKRFNLTATTNIFLVGQSNFSAPSMAILTSTSMSARRVR